MTDAAAGGRGRRSHPVRDALEAGLLHGFLGLLSPFSIDRASAIGGWLGRQLAPRLRQTQARRSIAETLPGADPHTLIAGMGDSLGRMLVELSRLELFARPEARSRFTFEGLEHLEAARATGKGIVFASGHFGNWEMAGPALTQLGVPFAGMTRPPDNPHLARFIARHRAASGTAQIDRGAEGSRQLFTRIRDGGAVVMLVDLRVLEGIPVPLFGRPAWTTYTPASLALTFDATILPIAVRRLDGARFHIVIHPPVAPPGTGNRARDTIEMTEALNRFVEAEVRAQPSAWLWYLKRWQPVPELSRRAQRLLTEAEQVA